MHLNSVLITGKVSRKAVATNPSETAHRWAITSKGAFQAHVPSDGLTVEMFSTDDNRGADVRGLEIGDVVRVVGALDFVGQGYVVRTMHVEAIHELTEAQRKAMAGVTEPR